MHDVIPTLVLLFWVTCAPKAPLAWSDPLRWMTYPLAYVATTTVAGASGYGYPYPFVDVEKLGFSGLIRTIVVFGTLFYALGLLVVATARTMTQAA